MLKRLVYWKGSSNMNNNIELDKIKFRWSTNFDKSKIKKNIIENFGYFPIAEGALKPVKNRYYLAFYENELIALSGIIQNKSNFLGKEISWTCTNKNYRNLGIMTFLINKMISKIDGPIFCECWHFNENERINLFMPLSKNGFKPIEEGIYSYDKKYFKKCNECCRKNECIGCKSDLWLRK